MCWVFGVVMLGNPTGILWMKGRKSYITWDNLIYRFFSTQNANSAPPIRNSLLPEHLKSLEILKVWETRNYGLKRPCVTVELESVSTVLHLWMEESRDDVEEAGARLGGEIMGSQSLSWCRQPAALAITSWDLQRTGSGPDFCLHQAH